MKPAIATRGKRGKQIDWQAEAIALPGARNGALPVEAPTPQLARLVDAPPPGEEWLHELKWDGYRLLATVHAGTVRLWSRNGLDWSERVPEVRDAIAALHLHEALLDGELKPVEAVAALMGRDPKGELL